MRFREKKNGQDADSQSEILSPFSNSPLSLSPDHLRCSARREGSPASGHRACRLGWSVIWVWRESEREGRGSERREWIALRVVCLFFFFFFFFWEIERKKKVGRKRKKTKRKNEMPAFSPPLTLSMLHRTNARAIIPTTCQRWLNFLGFGSSSGPPAEESSSLDCVDMIGTAAVGGMSWERHCLSRCLRWFIADRLRAPAMEAIGSEGARTEKRVRVG